mgnify:CR=1 FL=1
MNFAGMKIALSVVSLKKDRPLVSVMILKQICG